MMKEVKRMQLFSGLMAIGILLSGCGAGMKAADSPAALPQQSIQEEQNSMQDEQQTKSVQTGFITEQILTGADGEIHYSYYLPEYYDGNQQYPLVVTMPGYGMMWFGEDSSGSNVDWNGFRAWTELDEEMIVVSAQLTDWGETSARQAIELTEYFIENFSVDENRIYAAGYSAGGETMSQAVAMRPDLYAAYLHGASQWDGDYAPLAEEGVSVYIFMAENDEYYGSQRARDAYSGLRDAYEEAGMTTEEIDRLLQVEIPSNEYFNQMGIYNYHGGGNVVFDQARILNWITSARKQPDNSPQETGFSDVAADAWYAGAVEYVRDNGLMSGTSPTSFSPEAATSRAMLATILYRAAGSPELFEPPSFDDTPLVSWYSEGAAWASQSGIMMGYGNGLFGTNDPVTREQIATILWRYAGSPNVGDGEDFADESSIAEFAGDAVDWARANGIMDGVSGNRFLPKSNATRAQVAVILSNYLES